MIYELNAMDRDDTPFLFQELKRLQLPGSGFRLRELRVALSELAREVLSSSLPSAPFRKWRFAPLPERSRILVKTAF